MREQHVIFVQSADLLDLRSALDQHLRSMTSEGASMFDVICKRAAHPGSRLNKNRCRVGPAYACVCACMYVSMSGPLAYPSDACAFF